MAHKAWYSGVLLAAAAILLASLPLYGRTIGVLGIVGLLALVVVDAEISRRRRRRRRREQRIARRLEQLAYDMAVDRAIELDEAVAIVRGARIRGRS